MLHTLVYCKAFLFALLCRGQTQNALLLKNNHTLHYQVFGTGEPILIINGGPGMNCAGFQDMAKTLSDYGYQCILYDQRGTGNSSIPVIDSASITMEHMTADIEWLRQELKIDRWTVLGHSFGGILAACYAHRYPEPVDKLIFSSSGGLNLDFLGYIGERLQNNLSAQQRDSLAYYGQLIDAGDTSLPTLTQWANVLAHAYVYDDAFAPPIAKRLLQVKQEINDLVFTDLKRTGYDLTGQFGGFDRPVLVLQGRNDIISTETAQVIADNFSHSQLVLLDACGHYGWLDQPKAYFGAIRKFMH